MLYTVIAGNLETFLARQQQRGRSVPVFVERELRKFLECGVLACGFLRLVCEQCGRDKLVPLACKRRGFCPSCCGRRMADTAAHLVDRVLPRVGVRQWVLSLPFPLRYRMAYDASLTTAVLQVFIRTLFGFLRARARQAGIARSQCGAVTFIQRFGGSVNANLHFHVGLDGVYAEGAQGKPEFHPLAAPDDHDVTALAEELARRIPALLKRRGLSPRANDPDESDPFARDQPGLASMLAASVLGRASTGANAGGRVALTGDRIDPESLEQGYSARCASVAGFSLHANVFIPASDRARLEKLCRYTARPPLAIERLELLRDGRVRYRFRRPWRNGTTHAVFEPLQLLERLAALVPVPRANLVRYHGLLAPAAKWRSLVVPATDPPQTSPPVSDAGEAVRSPDAAAGSSEETVAAPAPRHGRNYAWAELMARVFSYDVLSCEYCGGKLRIIATINDRETTSKILDWLRLPSKPPPLSPAVLDPRFEFSPDWS